VLGQAAGFAVLAAVSPTALLVMAVFLASANPRVTALMYVAGAILMTAVMAVTLLFVLRAVGLNHAREHEPRYALRFGLGVVTLAAAVFIARRRRPPPAVSEDEAKRPGLVARLTASPTPRTAFLLGLLLFAPSTTFIAAVQVVATANAGVALTTGAMVVVIALSAAIVWLPLLAFLAAPDATTRKLRTTNEWLRARGRTLLVGAMWIAGAVLVVDGVLGLWG
jgi:Sap, sulfolipid-1-addressing protein